MSFDHVGFPDFTDEYFSILQAIVGSMGVAFFDGAPFRAEVTRVAVFNSGPTVRFVDFGNEAIIPFLGEEEDKDDNEQGWLQTDNNMQHFVGRIVEILFF